MKVISFSTLSRHGRLGNQLFAAASTIGLANRFGCVPLLDEGWPYCDYFNIPDKYFGSIKHDVVIKERHYHYDPGFLDGVSGDVVDIVGMFQSEKYWKEISNDIKKWFYPRGVKYLGYNSVCIHVRRGDYVNNPNYINLKPEYYYSAIKKYFNNSDYIFYVCSDDIDYCREIFTGNNFIIEKRGVIDDLKIMAGCRNHIMANSTLSWWGAYLSGSGGINIRPERVHTGKLAYLIEDDFWQPEWIVHSNKNKIIFITYSDENYYDKQDILMKRAMDSGQFDVCISYKKEDIINTDFFNINRRILEEKRGGGYWLWKPYFILKTMDNCDDGDIIFYLDCGDMFFGNIGETINDIMIDNNIVLTRGGNKNIYYTKRDCFILMGCDGREFHNAVQVEAGIILVKNCTCSRRIMGEWLKYCTNYDIISDNVITENNSCFIEHRHDQSILTNLSVLYNIPVSDALRHHIICNFDMVLNSPMIDLSDTTFVIPVKYDNENRRENIELVLRYLQKHLKTNIIVGEQGSNRYFEYLKDKYGIRYVYFDYVDFHRTKMLNEMFVMADTEIIFNWDADVIIDACQIEEAVSMMRNGDMFVYPYDGRFCRVDRKYINIINDSLVVYILDKINFPGCDIKNSVGGCVGFRRMEYLERGFENEHFISHAPEDVERYLRMKNMGDVKRVDGRLYHIDHFVGKDSVHKNQFVVINNTEFNKIKNFNKERWIKYINTWPWVKIYKERIIQKNK